MDGFTGREGVIVLAATNRPDVLDPALLRAGRFDRRVTVNPPDNVGRQAILAVHTRAVPLASEVDLKELAASTPRLVGADLRNLVNESALLAAPRQQDVVTERDFLDALEKLVLGPAWPLLIRPDDKLRLAYHEGGHTILGLVVAGADPSTRSPLSPAASAGPHLPAPSRRPSQLRRRLAARPHHRHDGPAEEIVYGVRTTGAENYMQQATDLARQTVTRWGMSDALVPISDGERLLLPSRG